MIFTIFGKYRVVNLLVSIILLTTCALFYSNLFPSKPWKSTHNNINGDWDYEH